MLLVSGYAFIDGGRRLMVNRLAGLSAAILTGAGQAHSYAAFTEKARQWTKSIARLSWDEGMTKGPDQSSLRYSTSRV
jgi:hypothetical protein